MPDAPPPDPAAAAAEAPAPFARGFAAAVDDVSGSGRWVVARINTGGVDRFNTVVLPGGMDQREFERNNRLVLWEHGKDPSRGRVPIGRNRWINHRRDRDDLLAKTEFAKDDFSQGMFELYRDGVLRGWSVYGLPSTARGDVGPPTPAELKARPDWKGAAAVYRRWALTEYSGVAFPGNTDAVTEEVSRGLAGALARGLWLPDSLRALAAAAQAPPPAPAPPPEPPKLPPLRGRTLDEASADLMRRFDEAARRMTERAARDALDLARGRV